MTGSPGEEHRTNKPPLTGRIQERSKGDAACPSTSQNPPCWHSSWLSNEWTIRKDPESERQARDNPITIKPEVTSHVTGQFSWVPLPSYSAPPRCPFPIKSLALSTVCLLRQSISECQTRTHSRALECPLSCNTTCHFQNIISVNENSNFKNLIRVFFFFLT